MHVEKNIKYMLWEIGKKVVEVMTKGRMDNNSGIIRVGRWSVMYSIDRVECVWSSMVNRVECAVDVDLEFYTDGRVERCRIPIVYTYIGEVTDKKKWAVKYLKHTLLEGVDSGRMYTVFEHVDKIGWRVVYIGVNTSGMCVGSTEE